MQPTPKDHTLDEDGVHDPDACSACLLDKEIQSPCRCAACCRRLLIEVGLEDAEREPRIKELGSPVYAPAELTESGRKELEGYLLNSREDLACVFLDRQSNLCSIYETRPLACRLFDCDGAGREQLIELGILSRERVGEQASTASGALLSHVATKDQPCLPPTKNC
jgi:Fe-S-cluster containining protein